MWVNGPFKCGSFPDLKIFCNDLVHFLDENEKVIADGGYPHRRCVSSNELEGSKKVVHSRRRARHETVNSRLKNFFVLTHTFRHDRNLHVYCFHAVAQVTSVMLKYDPLFT